MEVWIIGCLSRPRRKAYYFTTIDERAILCEVLVAVFAAARESPRPSLSMRPFTGLPVGLRLILSISARSDCIRVDAVAGPLPQSTIRCDIVDSARIRLRPPLQIL